MLFCDLNTIWSTAARCETMENKSIELRRMGINYKGSQAQTERAVALYEEEEEEEEYEEEEEE